MAGTSSAHSKSHTLQSSPQPQRWLLPYLQFGPNNQYEQLMEAAAVAKALGRALILPRFQAWAGDRSSSANTTVPFETTFDTAALRRYLPVVTVDALRRFLIGERTHTLLALTGLDESKFLRAQQLPCCPRRKRAHSEPLRSAAEARTFVRAQGLHQAKVLGWHSFFGVAERPLLLDAARAFQRAPAIRSWARAAATKLFDGQPFLAVHLRREATKLGCAAGHPSVLCSKPGAQYSVETEQVASEITRARQLARVHRVYIATIWPSRRRRWEHELPTLLTTVTGARSLSNLTEMVATLGVSPSAMSGYTLSLIEQEICATAAAFLGSERSTWTGNVELQRSAYGRRSSMFGQSGCAPLARTRMAG